MKSNLILMRLALAAALSAAQASAGSPTPDQSGRVALEIQIEPRFGGQPLVFDELTNRTAAGQEISVTRLDFLVSDVELRKENGDWLRFTNVFAYVSEREGRTRFELVRTPPPASLSSSARLHEVPATDYDRIRFHLGLRPEINHSDAAQYPAEHPLNPDVNGLHWGWMGGYVFLALEGRWVDSAHAPKTEPSGYSYHLATDRMLMSIEVPIRASIRVPAILRFVFNVDQLFNSQPALRLDPGTFSTHSRTNDALADLLERRVERAIQYAGLAPLTILSSSRGLGLVVRRFSLPGTMEAGISSSVQSSPSPQPKSPIPLYNPRATPYRFTFSSLFPRPSLPSDNPLTEQGVALGRRLFLEPALSVNDSQSCASCHQPAAGYAEHKRFSTGAEGKFGTRNAMAILNLAWKSSFFWDGRAATLREQVLQPIQNSNEMHENLTRVAAKLAVEKDKHNEPIYPALFEAAFGSPEINGDRIARALEQFLLVQTAYDSKFDRVVAGQAQFTPEEQRGFELFHTEYDPRRGQFGADCFHCHGGPLFQNQAFANNGLDTQSKDPGRVAVTGRDGDRGKFAVPSLRNVELTAPYMHDGRFATLEEAVEHYCTGMKRSATLDPNLAKHPDGGVPLSAEDKRALVAFLKTLTDIGRGN